jgi:AcrR family transcriptional regulator
MLMAAERSRAGQDGAIRARRLQTVPPTSPVPLPDTSAGAREHLARIQRARILAGAVDAASERGAANVHVAEIVARCGVSRRTFYENFADRDECFLAVFEDALAQASTRVLAAVEPQSTWLAKLRAGIAAFLRFLDEEPKLGRLLVCDSLTAGPRVLARRSEITARLAAFLGEGARESKLAADTPPLYAEGSVGGALAILHDLLLPGTRESNVKLAPTLTAMVVMPYLGPAAARRELQRPVEHDTPITPANPDSLADPFKHAGMRLTYRTVRVLAILAEQGGPGVGLSNRALGELAGVRDQGQISKLLWRLQRFGLIDNGHAERAQGAPNAWALTPAGRRLADSVRQHTGA